MPLVSPSLLSCDFKQMGEELKRIELAGADYAHLDVMDGTFVPNISFGIPVIKSIRSASNIVFDVHLMVQEPDHLIDAFAKAGSDIITIHLEACKDVRKTLQHIKDCGKRTGLSIKPNTKIEELFPYLDLVDMILIMTVEPGFGGQALIPECLEKVKALKVYLNQHNYFIPIEIDGGVCKEKISEIRESGADILVAGSAVFGAEDIKEAISFFKK